MFVPCPTPLPSNLKPLNKPLADTHRPAVGLALLSAALLLGLGGCASRTPQTPSNSGSNSTSPSRPSSWPDKDGPEAVIPPNLHQVPNATPQLEPIRKGGPNKPYEVLGQRYEPITEDKPLVERGLASWYGKKFHGRSTSSGEIYNMYAMTAAHPTMPIPSYARVRNPANGREIVVRINDRGPFHSTRVIDLSYTAALKLDILRGVTPVEVERITFEDIRSGAWQRGKGFELGQPETAVFAAAEAEGAAQRESTAQIAEAGAATRPVAVVSTPRHAAPGFWVQLGAYSKLDGAETFRQQLLKELDWMAPLLAVFKDGGLHRLQAGPYGSRDDARQAAERVRLALNLTPVVVERR
ncbi:septal ring lytic transglycosylase RlpA family protein [Paucibacter sp. Y2R2-4]|uniref:septal ring lytic transglycosylase RlpA family protein n=1 Tax=Paucibacter sp. Y2R2-4 TaxID=2893553 RepID=UPI0021E442C6|nr:septal ring lytic transglycosylase RlpA family protein [Paucibacter sp. Y2R2-4]MCV2350628.1 septal ring lytic transglycosylase RlpA family protein [Paucibacter sp. Y2R2-4]